MRKSFCDPTFENDTNVTMFQDSQMFLVIKIKPKIDKLKDSTYFTRTKFNTQTYTFYKDFDD